MAARGCGGVWCRVLQRGPGGSCSASRPRRAVACNARGGAVPLGQSGYGAGIARGGGPRFFFLVRESFHVLCQHLGFLCMTDDLNKVT